MHVRETRQGLGSFDGVGDVLSQAQTIAIVQSWCLAGWGLIGVSGISTWAAVDQVAGSILDEWAPWLPSGAADRAILKNYAQLARIINDWSTRRAAWAAMGKRDDGSVYTLPRWYDEGATYAQMVKDQSGLAIEPTTLQAIRDAALATAHTVSSPTEWPWWLMAAAGLAVAYYGSQIYGNVRTRRSAA